MEITKEYLLEQRRNLELEREKAWSFIKNAEGGLAMIDNLLERLNPSEVEE